MYSKIINPDTGRKVSINGKIGRNVLRNYLNILKGGLPEKGEKICIDNKLEEVEKTMDNLHGEYIFIKKNGGQISKLWDADKMNPKNCGGENLLTLEEKTNNRQKKQQIREQVMNLRDRATILEQRGLYRDAELLRQRVNSMDGGMFSYLKK